MRRVVVALLVAVSLFVAVTACAPPPDVPRERDDATEPQANGDGAEDPATGNGASGGEEPRGGTAADPGAGAGSGSGSGLYVKLGGGVRVLRCPSCAETQPEGATKCAGCNHAIRARGTQAECTLCAGDGRCRHCGDDRDCLACGAVGTCAYCDGSGRLGDVKCEECAGSGKCRPCAGDGRRESVTNDFGPFETALPGICPTCLDGRGLCPECGGLGIDASEERCLACEGKSLCWDCAGVGTCSYDGGDGLCPACGGSGVEVWDLPRLPVHARRWIMRRDSGTILTGRQLVRPDPNLRVDPGGGAAAIALVRESVHPLTYFQAYRDFTDPGDAEGLMHLASIAEDAGYFPLARWALNRAMEADPAVATEARQSLRKDESRLVQAWLEAASKALEVEDRERGKRLLLLVRNAEPGTEFAVNARTRLQALDTQERIERDQMDAETRKRIEIEALAAVERTLRGVDRRLSLSKRLLQRARSEQQADHAIERLFDRAEWVAYDTQRRLLETARRHPPKAVRWPRSPVELLATIRKQRAAVLHERAVRQVAGGRFDVAKRFAHRADRLDPGNALVAQVLAQAERGILRRGVHLGSPPPKKDGR